MPRTISLQGSDLAAGETAKIRNLTYYDAEGNPVTVKALLTADVTIPEGGGPAEFPPDGWEELADALVDIKWDSDYHKLQIKRGTILVKTGTVATTWTDLLAFAEFNV